jgi:hypothetical protein
VAGRLLEGVVLTNRRSSRVAAVALFGALYAVLRLVVLPFPVLGGGVTFPVADIAASLYGLILGPLSGGLGVVLGTFLGFALGRPVTFAFLDFLPATVNAVGVGLAVRGRASWSAGLFLLLLGLFIVHPLALPVVDLDPALPGVLIPFNWMHFVALALLVSPLRTRAVTALRARGVGMSWSVALLNFVGTMMQHVTGGLLFAAVRGGLLGLVAPEAFPAIWTTIFWVYPGERAFIVALATVVGVPVLRSVLGLGPLPGGPSTKEGVTTAHAPGERAPRARGRSA